MIIKNIDSHDIQIPFEGTTYIFPQDKAVSNVPAQVKDFIEERFPLSFSYGAQLQKEKAEDVQTFKTKIYTAQSVYNNTQDMQITPVRATPTFGDPSNELPLNGQSDRDGIEFYGEGIEVETV